MTPGEQEAPALSVESGVRYVFDERPWGRFDQFTQNQRSTVKILTVEPGQRLSLQRHARRSEFWVVVDGPVDVTVGEDMWSAVEGDHIWVPAGAVHRLGNSGSGRARILEIGFGDFDEDDIERLEDDYSR